MGTRLRQMVPLLAVALLAQRTGWADTLTLKEEAYVKGPQIKLGEVADIDGQNAVRLADIDVTIAPMPGDSRVLNAALVSARLKSAGIDPSLIQFKGANNIKTTTLHTEITGAFLEESLREYIAASMPWQAGNVDVEIQVPADKILVPEGVPEISWESNPQYRYVGPGTFRGKLTVDARPQRTLLCSANITAFSDVVVAARDIGRGKPIGPFDIETRRMPVSNANQGLLLGPNDVIGLLASRTIFPGDPLSTRNTQLPKVVRRNQLTPVELHAGGLMVRSQARALTDGAVGETVRCVNDGSKQELTGVVRRDGVVVVN